jgi:hypothetical protein
VVVPLKLNEVIPMSTSELFTQANGQSTGFAPPYTSFQTMLNLLDRMAEEGGVPARLDGSYLTNLPGSVQATMKQSMKALDLIDEDLRPTEALIELVENPDERKSILSGIIREKYAGPLTLDKRATTAQLEGKFREYGIRGSTTRKAIAFFLSAARYADIPISPHFRIPKITPGERKTRTKPEIPNQQPAQNQQRDKIKIEHHPLIQGLFQELPPVGSEFTDEQQADWLELAKITFRVIYKTPTKGSRAIPDFSPTPGGEDSD